MTEREARLLVSHMLPGYQPGSTVETCWLAKMLSAFLIEVALAQASGTPRHQASH